MNWEGKNLINVLICSISLGRTLLFASYSIVSRLGIKDPDKVFSWEPDLVKHRRKALSTIQNSSLIKISENKIVLSPNWQCMDKHKIQGDLATMTRDPLLLTTCAHSCQNIMNNIKYLIETGPSPSTLYNTFSIWDRSYKKKIV